MYIAEHFQYIPRLFTIFISWTVFIKKENKKFRYVCKKVIHTGQIEDMLVSLYLMLLAF